MKKQTILFGISLVAAIDSLTVEPWAHCRIDYSAANEFIAAHYGKQVEYFASDLVEEPIFNARQGVDGHIPSMSGCGFILLDHRPTACSDFGDPEQVRAVYLDEVRQALEQVYETPIRRIFFGTR